MEGFYAVLADVMAHAGILSCFLGVFGMGMNMMFRACTGKEVLI